ncbi:MAG: N-acetylmuramic acid 6-phosphate etherase [Geminicoccaceae bacterium]
MDTEDRADRYRGMERWSDADVMLSLFAAQTEAVSAVHGALPQLVDAAAAAVPRLRAGGRLAYAGAGTSGRLAVLDGTELLPTFGFPRERTLFFLAGGEHAMTRSIEGAEDDAGAAGSEVERAAVARNDVVIAVAASGRTPYTLAVCKEAERRGALTIALAGNQGSPLLHKARHPIVLASGAEPIAGSTRLKAGTAQKIALNLLSTFMMIRLGHVFDGLMVDVQPTNAKLQARALAIVAELAGVDDDRAGDALRRTDGQVKRAILVARGLDPAEAQRALEAVDGHLERLIPLAVHEPGA